MPLCLARPIQERLRQGAQEVGSRLQRLHLHAATGPHLRLAEYSRLAFHPATLHQPDEPLGQLAVAALVPAQGRVEAAVVAVGLGRLLSGELVLHAHVGALGGLLAVLVNGGLSAGGARCIASGCQGLPFSSRCVTAQDNGALFHFGRHRARRWAAGHMHRAPCGQAATRPTRRLGLACFRSRRPAAAGSHAEGSGARRPAAALQAAPRPRGRFAAWGRRKPASAPAEADPPTGRWRSGGVAPPHPLKAGGQLAGRQPFRLRLTAGPTARQRGVRRAGCPPVGLAARGQRVGARY